MSTTKLFPVKAELLEFCNWVLSSDIDRVIDRLVEFRTKYEKTHTNIKFKFFVDDEGAAFLRLWGEPIV